MGRFVDKIAVMGDIQDGALIAVDGVLQDFLGHYVQVVGGLVQYEEIGVAQHKLGQGDPAPLSAA